MKTEYGLRIVITFGMIIKNISLLKKHLKARFLGAHPEVYLMGEKGIEKVN